MSKSTHDPLCEASSGNPYAVLANQISTDLVGWCSTCELIAKVRADEAHKAVGRYLEERRRVVLAEIMSR